MVCSVLRNKTRYVLLILNLIFLIFPSLAYAGEQDACAAAQASDLNNDGVVAFADITLLFAHWGHTDPGIPDPDGDGIVSFGDIFFMLPYFGPVSEHCVEAIDLCGNLDLIREDLSADYILSCDIDLTGLAFEPIGTTEAPFTGTLNGQGHSIFNLSIQTSGQTGVGLFGSIVGGEVRNLNVLNANVSSTGGNDIGILAGFTNSTLIENCTSSGMVTGDGQRTGGLVGHADPGTVIRTSSSSADVTGNIGVGVLSGVNHGSLIENCSATGSATGIERVGGLLGYSAIDANTGIPTITRNCSASGNANGAQYVGGFIGYHNEESVIENSSASGSAVASIKYAGGFAGAVLLASHLSGVTASGSASANQYAGGLVGRMNWFSTIENAVAYGDVTSNHSIGGGLAGNVSTNCEVNSSQAFGSVTVGGDYAGGLVGYLTSDSSVHNSKAFGNVTGERYSGGLVGLANSGITITFSGAEGNTTSVYDGHGNIPGYNGGFIGKLIKGVITDSYAVGDLVTDYSQYNGGFIGGLDESIIERSYYVGDVTTEKDAAGFVGTMRAGDTTPFLPSAIRDSYAIGTVTTTGHSSITGFLDGSLGGDLGLATIENCFTAMSLYTSWSDPNAFFTGIANGGNGEAHNLYWDMDVANTTIGCWWQCDLNEVIGLTTAEMMNASNFPEWDFENVWAIQPGQSYPYLQWQGGP